MDRGTILLSCRVDAPDGLDAAYDMYAVGLYDYCHWALGESLQAEDAVHNALLAAAGRGLLSAGSSPVDGAAAAPMESEPLRAWIYTAARNECLRLAAFTRQRATPPTSAGGTRFTGAGWHGLTHHQPSRAELWQLARLRRALDQLSVADQEVAELAFRHGFGSAGLAVVVGRPLGKVRKTVAAIYSQLAADCDDGVAATFAVPPFQAPPPSLRRLVLEAAAVPARLKHLAERQAPYNRFGFPKPADRRRHVRPAAAVAVGMGAVLVLSAGLVAENQATTKLGTSAHRERPGLAAPSAGPTHEPAAPARLASSAPTPAAAATPTPTAPGRAARPPRPRPHTLPRPAVPRGLSTAVRFTYDMSSRTWDAILTATVRGADVRKVRIALWWEDAAGRHRKERTATRVGGNTYQVTARRLPHGPVACVQATAFTTDGAVLKSPVVSPMTGPGGYTFCGNARLGRR